MQIVGYCVHGNKQYVIFKDEKKLPDMFKITDGFHDKEINAKDVDKYKDYCRVGRREIDLEKIVSRMRGTRPWHPLLKLIGRENGI